MSRFVNTLPLKNASFIVSATSATQSCNSRAMPSVLSIARIRPYCHSCYACTGEHSGCTPSWKSVINYCCKFWYLDLVHAQASHVVNPLGITDAKYRQQQQEPISSLFVNFDRFNHLLIHFFARALTDQRVTEPLYTRYRLTGHDCLSAKYCVHKPSNLFIDSFWFKLWYGVYYRTF